MTTTIVLFISIAIFLLNDLPPCQAVCTDPPAIGNGIVTNSGTYNEGTKAVYTCDVGYQMSGPADDLVCSSAEWVGLKPSCVVGATASSSSTFVFPDEVMYSLIGVGGLLVVLIVSVICLAVAWCCQKNKEQRVVHILRAERGAGQTSTVTNGYNVQDYDAKRMVVPVVAASYK